MIMKTHLHRLEDIIVSHPGARLARSLLAWLGPDLVEAWNDEGSPENAMIMLMTMATMTTTMIMIMRMPGDQDNQDY